MLGSFVEFFRIITNIIYSVSQSEMKTTSTIWPYALGAMTVVGGVLLTMYLAEPMKLIYIPMILVLAGVVLCFSMYISMRRILPIRIDFIFIGLSALYSLPFFIMFLVRNYFDTLMRSIFLCGIFGLYLLWVIWKLHQHVETNRDSLLEK